ncbi:hypothetical protein BgiMline_013764 [Biomphalaria glabrata]
MFTGFRQTNGIGLCNYLSKKYIYIFGLILVPVRINQFSRNVQSSDLGIITAHVGLKMLTTKRCYWCRPCLLLL